MDQPRICPQCGAELPRDAMDGLCPKCMARVVFGECEAAGVRPEQIPAATIRVDPEADVMERAGMRIGRYKLLEKIGEGGFGVVYLAEQIEPVQRKVALKVIKAGMDTREVIARFEAERQALALMDHPNIARVLDVGTTNAGRPYFVMELVKGIPITDYCDQNRLPVQERLQLFMKVCQAVQHAHQKAIIHRDLKPHNVLVTQRDGEPVPKVIDFGIAKALGPKLTEKTLFTGFANLLGTPAYMSPEQAELGGLDIDTRSDIYSLGVLLYELLTGVTPFDRELLAKSALDEMRRMIRETEPPKPSTRLHTLGAKLGTVAQHRRNEPASLTRLVRGDLDCIVMKCLEKDRKRRYETANGLATDLQRHLSNEPVVARPVSEPARLWRWCRRKPALAGTVLMLVVVAFTTTVAAIRIERGQHRTKEALRESYVAQARANRSSHRAGRRFESLEALAKAAAIRPGIDLRNEAVACMTLADLRMARQWSSPKIITMAADRRFVHYARSDTSGSVSVRRLHDDQILVQLPGPGETCWQLRFSPNDRYLATRYHADGRSNTNTVCVWNWQKQTIHWQPPFSTGVFDFSPDSRLFAVRQWGGPIVFCDLVAAKEANRAVTQIKTPGGRVRFSPNGRQLACYGTEDSSIEVLDVASGSRVSRVEVPARVVEVAWHPEGTLLAVCGYDDQIYICEANTNQPLRSLHGHQSVPTTLAFTHSGDVLASSAWDETIRLWDVLTGKQLATFQGRVQDGLSFSEDDQLLGMVRGPSHVGALEVATGRELRTLAGHPQSPGERVLLRSADVSLDGRWLASAGSDGVRLWDLLNGKQLAFLRGAESMSALFHPDGQSLITTGGTGVRRWPILGATNGPQTPIQFGLPDVLSAAGDFQHACLSPDGQRLAVVGNRSKLSIFEFGSTGQVIRLQAPPVARFVAFSPDGRWLATGTEQGLGGVRIWDTQSGEAILDLPLKGNAQVAFSPNGRWLVTGTGEEFRFWEAGTWQPRHRIEKPVQQTLVSRICFSRDGAMLAVELTRSLIRLIEPESGRELATLEAAYQTPLCFTPDGSRLVVAGEDQRINIWDLHSIRQQLAAMKLDW